MRLYSSTLNKSAEKKPLRVAKPTQLGGAKCVASGSMAAQIMVSMAPAAKPSMKTMALCGTHSPMTAPSAAATPVISTKESHMVKMRCTLMPCRRICAELDKASGKLDKNKPANKVYGNTSQNTTGVPAWPLAVTVASWMELLNTKLPRNTYAPGCHRTLYSAGCGVSKAAKTVAGSVTAAISRSAVASALAQADGYFNLGTLVFNTGANAGISRTVKSYAGGQFVFILPLPYDPTVGDTFSVYPGCDKTQATCTSKFSNLARFRGMPYIPQADTIT